MKWRTWAVQTIAEGGPLGWWQQKVASQPFVMKSACGPKRTLINIALRKSIGSSFVPKTDCFDDFKALLLQTANSLGEIADGHQLIDSSALSMPSESLSDNSAISLSSMMNGGARRI